MAYNPIPPNGQATMANSQPVVVASDQSSLLVSPRVVGSTPVTVTSSLLNSLAISGVWHSARIDISYTTTGNNYSDILIGIKTSIVNSGPTGEKAAYVFIVPWYKVNNTPTWIPASVGNTTDIGDAQATLANFGPLHSAKLAAILPANAGGTILSDVILLSNVFGKNMPDAFTILIQNSTGVALGNTSTISYNRLV